MDLHWGFYDKLRPAQIEAIQKENPIAYLPWGAIEYHGNHNPTGLDTHKAQHLCTDVASKVGGLVLPPVSIAANLIKSYPGVNFPKHSIEFSEKVIKQICKEYLEQLASQHFKIIMLLSGHAGEPHLQILRDTANTYNKKHSNSYCWALAEFDILPDALLVANHSALGETSLQLYYEPQTVNLESLPKNREITLETDAVSGDDPRPATSLKGKKIVTAFVKNASEKLEELKKKYC